MFSCLSLDQYQNQLLQKTQTLIGISLKLSKFIPDEISPPPTNVSNKQRPLDFQRVQTRGKTNILSQKIKKDKREYLKITKQQKSDLIHKVFHQDMKIKDVFSLFFHHFQAAQQCDVKYATAKTIIFGFRKTYGQNKPVVQQSKPKLRVSYRDFMLSEIRHLTTGQFQIITQIEGVKRNIYNYYSYFRGLSQEH